MKILFISLVLYATMQAVFAGEKYILSQEQWSQPKQVDTVLNMPAVNGVLTEIHKSPGSQLLILYPGGDEGTLWAHELKAWLVSLGVSSRQIELRPGSGEPTSLELQLELPLSGNIRQNEPVQSNSKPVAGVVSK